MTAGHTTNEATWIRRYHQAPDSAVRLVCFPHAGGSASAFFPVSALLAPAVEVCAVQYPGRQDRRAEANIDNIPDLADAIFQVVRRPVGRRLAFFGHSMGAVLAFEVALRLEQDGVEPPALLVVSGRRAPSCRRPGSVHERDDRGIIAELRRLSGTDSDLLGDPETVQMILPAIRNDYRAIETYDPEPGRSVSCPVTAYLGDRDPQVTIAEAKEWAIHTTGPFDLRLFTGGHFYLTAQKQQVVDALSADLASFS